MSTLETNNSVVLFLRDKVYKFDRNVNNLFPHEFISYVLMYGVDGIVPIIGVSSIINRKLRKMISEDEMSESALTYELYEADLEKFLNDMNELGEEYLVQYIEDIVLQVCQVMSSLHCRGFVHGDINPKNFLINTSPELTVSLTDLGCCYPLKETRACYTKGFRSPQVEFGKKVNSSKSSDVWALGATLFSIITGEVIDFDNPLLDNDKVEEFKSEISDLLLSYVDYFPNIGEQVVRVCLKCLEPDETKRYSNCVDVYSDLTSTTNCVLNTKFSFSSYKSEMNDSVGVVSIEHSKLSSLLFDVCTSIPGWKEGNYDDFVALTRSSFIDDISPRQTNSNLYRVTRVARFILKHLPEIRSKLVEYHGVNSN